MSETHDQDQLPGGEAGAPAEAMSHPGGQGEPSAAQPVTLRQRGAPAVQAESVRVEQGGIGRAEAHQVDVKDGGIGVARGDSVTVTNGGVGVVVARQARLDGATVAIVAAGHVSGTARILVDLRAAVVLGAILGGVFGLRKALTNRKPRAASKHVPR
jgi:hypothetical protein